MKKIIDIIGLSKSFGSKEVLKDLNLSLDEGESIVILGKSGIGKSVLLKCIVGLIIPDAGTIRLFGDDVMDYDEASMDKIRRKIGYLFQGGAIYDSMSVRENLEFPVKRTLKIRKANEIDELVIEALENVGLADAISKKPSELSGGMRKRLGLARTLITKREIILYDEPTTGLDPVTSQEISELIVEIQKTYHTSSMIVTHDIRCARITGDHLKMLKDGNIQTEGRFEELKKSSDREIQAYFN